MYCNRCGNEILPGDSFCGKCGKPVPAAKGGAARKKAPGSSGFPDGSVPGFDLSDPLDPGLGAGDGLDGYGGGAGAVGQKKRAGHTSNPGQALIGIWTGVGSAALMLLSLFLPLISTGNLEQLYRELLGSSMYISGMPRTFSYFNLARMLMMQGGIGIGMGIGMLVVQLIAAAALVLFLLVGLPKLSFIGVGIIGLTGLLLCALVSIFCMASLGIASVGFGFILYLLALTGAILGAILATINS